MDQDNALWIRPYLEAGEQILWLGKPEKLHLLSAQDVFLIPFSLLWFGFVVFWEIAAFRMGAPWFFPLFGAFFVMIGLYLTVGRFLWKAYVLRHTLYAITDRKTLIQHGNRVEVLLRYECPPLSVTQYRDGTGTIHFSSPSSMLFRRSLSPNLREWHMLHGVSQPERLLRLLNSDTDSYI